MALPRLDILLLNALGRLALDKRLGMDPLTSKGTEIMKNMEDQYGKEKGKSVFYASRNKGTIKGVDEGNELHKFLTGSGLSEDDANEACSIAAGADCDAKDDLGFLKPKPEPAVMQTFNKAYAQGAGKRREDERTRNREVDYVEVKGHNN